MRFLGLRDMMTDVEYILRRITGAQESANSASGGTRLSGSAEKEVGAFEGFGGILASRLAASFLGGTATRWASGCSKRRSCSAARR